MASAVANSKADQLPTLLTKLFAEPTVPGVGYYGLQPASGSRRHSDSSSNNDFSGMFLSPIDLFESAFGSSTNLSGLLSNLMKDATTPALLAYSWVDKEDKDSLTLKVALPGLGKDHIKVWAEKNTLMIKRGKISTDVKETKVDVKKIKVDVKDGKETKEDGKEIKETKEGKGSTDSKENAKDGEGTADGKEFVKVVEGSAEDKEIVKVVEGPADGKKIVKVGEGPAADGDDTKEDGKEIKEIKDGKGSTDSKENAKDGEGTADGKEFVKVVEGPAEDKEIVKVVEGPADGKKIVKVGEGPAADGDDTITHRIELPADTFKMDQIKAEMNNGLLKVTLRKVKEEERKDVFQINID